MLLSNSTKSPEFTVLFTYSFTFCWIRIRNYNVGSGSSQKFRIRIHNHNTGLLYLQGTGIKLMQFFVHANENRYLFLSYRLFKRFQIFIIRTNLMPIRKAYLLIELGCQTAHRLILPFI